MTAPFKDLFSAQSVKYARHRPGYPETLFTYLASLPAGRRLAVDCATGSGQAAVGLAPHFNAVVAVDLSRRQLAKALFHPKVSYRAAPAEQLPVPDASVDLVSVASALHWFDLDRFYPEVRRVLAPGGVLAAWCFGRGLKITPEVDAVLERLAFEVLGPFWEPELRHVWADYRTLPFPFVELPAPRFRLHEEWELSRLLGDLSTWSAVQKYREVRVTDPLEEVGAALRAAWGPPERRRLVSWDICCRLGRRA